MQWASEGAVDNVDFERQAAAFETRLGAFAFGDSRANNAAAAMGRRAIAYMDARVNLQTEITHVERTMDEMLRMCGTDVNAVWAGRVGNTAESVGTIRTVLEGGGNLREMCNHVGGFMENVLGTEFLNESRAYLEQLGAEARVNMLLPSAPDEVTRPLFAPSR